MRKPPVHRSVRPDAPEQSRTEGGFRPDWQPSYVAEAQAMPIHHGGPAKSMNAEKIGI